MVPTMAVVGSRIIVLLLVSRSVGQSVGSVWRAPLQVCYPRIVGLQLLIRHRLRAKDGLHVTVHVLYLVHEQDEKECPHCRCQAQDPCHGLAQVAFVLRTH